MSNKQYQSLQAGLKHLAQGRNDKDQRDSALVKIHTALELYLRDRLIREQRVDNFDIDAMKMVSDADWPKLLSMAQDRHIISAKEYDMIRSFNSYRNRHLHQGESYPGTYQELEQYAHFVERLVNSSVNNTKRSYQSANSIFNADDDYEALLELFGFHSANELGSQQTLPSNHSSPGVSTSFSQPVPRINLSSTSKQLLPSTRWILIVLAGVIALFILWNMNSEPKLSSNLPAGPTPTLGLSRQP